MSCVTMYMLNADPNWSSAGDVQENGFDIYMSFQMSAGFETIEMGLVA